MKNFNVGVKGVTVHEGKILILKSQKGYWEVPGGRIDGDETIEETLKRELKEEVPNIKDIEPKNLLHVARLPRDIASGTGLILIFFEVKANFDGDPEISDEHIEYKLASKEEALSVVEEGTKQALLNMR